MTPITSEELARAVGCAAPTTTTPEIRGVSIDTRTVNPGDAFFAMPGARVDPHDLLPDAVAAGAVVVVAERMIQRRPRQGQTDLADPRAVHQASTPTPIGQTTPVPPMPQ